ncbi:tripartite tricarboxylate transporter substrate binding protein [Microbacteriaceae bacterium K1510]|nr:tripartite tricarboxylate transporter substrate binding protein [Microbacteriaceae bacterium K1510]
MDRLRFLAKVAALLALAVMPAHADDAANYPTRAIRVIVAFPPGGGPDPLARIVASGLERRLGQPVIVENMPGGSGSLAARATVRGGPDGYTLLFADMTFIVSPHVTANFGVDPLKDFQPVGRAATSPFSLIVSASVPASNLSDFIKLAKTHPDEVMIGHAGIGTTPYLGAVAFTKAADIKPRFISYKGMADAMTNAMSGIISGLFSAGPSAISSAKNDKLKVLAVTGDKRMVQLPNIPTFGESGITLRGFESGAWFGLMAPMGTPPGVIQKINTALNDIANDKMLMAKFESAGAEFRPGTPQEFRDQLVEQDKLWGATLTELGVKPQ